MSMNVGGAEGDRTPDLMTASHALSQLSYGPNIEIVENCGQARVARALNERQAGSVSLRMSDKLSLSRRSTS